MPHISSWMLTPKAIAISPKNRPQDLQPGRNQVARIRSIIGVKPQDAGNPQLITQDPCAQDPYLSVIIAQSNLIKFT